MSPLSDGALRELLIEDPRQGWRAFIDQYTPVLQWALCLGGVAERPFR